jgi:outer membrane protein OmpA-like peptidoglycan-associated protein
MTNTQQQQATQQRAMRSGKEVAVLVGVFLMAGAGMLATYWVSFRDTEAKPAAVAGVAAEAATAQRAGVAAASDPEGVHADVYFDFKSTRLRADAVRILQEKAVVVDRASAWVVLVQGHADRQGPAEYNKVLAQRRADAVRQFLIELGVPEASIKVVAIGQEGALCDEPTKECQQLNRRVHVEIRKLARAAAAAVPAEVGSGGEREAGSTGTASPVAGR